MTNAAAERPTADWIEQPPAEEQAGEDQKVLGPLAWTQRREQV